jgi:hypothetical protein
MTTRQLVANDATQLAAVEVGVGSLLHALHVPLAGTLLSLNQAAFLAYSLKRRLPALAGVARRTHPFAVSQAAALLKSLSPAGKRLTPMLAISAQGTLFAVGTCLLGPNLAGVLLGATLLSVWAFVQVALVGWLLLGSETIEIAARVAGEFALAAVLGKAAIAVTLAALTWWRPAWFVERWERAESLAKHRRANPRPETATSTPWRQAARDLLHPLPLLAIALPVFLFGYSQKPATEILWLSLRTLALTYLGFVLLSTRWLNSIIGRVTSTSKSPYLRACEARSAHTAITSTTPLTMYCQNGSRLAMLMPLLRLSITSAPKIAPSTVPRPPSKLVPPITQDAIASSSSS